MKTKQFRIYVFLFLIFSIRVFALDVQINYLKYPEEKNKFYPWGSQRCELKTSSKIKDLKLPKLQSDFPIYSTVKIAGNEYTLLFDKMDKDDSFFTLIYIDANLNNDLTDDPKIEGEEKWYGDYYCNINFKSADFKYKLDGVELPFSISARSYINNIKKGEKLTSGKLEFVYVDLQCNCCYTGNFELDGQKYFFMLGDYNIDGDFGNTFTVNENVWGSANKILYAQGDNLFISTNEKFNYDEGFTLGNYIVLKDKTYEIKVITKDKKLVLTEIQKDIHPIKLSEMDTKYLQIYNTKNNSAVMVYNSGKEFKLPEGKYRLFTYSAVKKTASGDVWKIGGRGVPEVAAIDVGEGKNPVLLYGEPYKCVAELPYWQKQNLSMNASMSQVQLSLSIIGVGGDNVDNLGRLEGKSKDVEMSSKYNDRPKEAKFKIIKQDGSIVKEGVFEYG